MSIIKRAANMAGMSPTGVSLRPGRRNAMGTTPFDAAGHGRRGYGWNPTMLGLNTLLYSHGLELLERNRDATRNNPWAASAIESYVANAIGKGIHLIHQHPVEATREEITKKWTRWCGECDVEYTPQNPGSGQENFLGKQIVTAREVMEAGEQFVRFVPRPLSDGLTVPLQLQLIEAEQLPIWRMNSDEVPDQNRVRFGIEYRPDLRRAAYHFWKVHPGDTMFFPTESLQIERVLAKDVLHVYKPVRSGQMRGMPWMTPVLAKLYSLDKYMDSEIFRKEVSSMITGFIKQTTVGGAPIFTEDTTVGQPQDTTTQISKLEPGSFPVLNPGEEIEFADVKDSGDFSAFIRTGLQAFASGCGLAEYQVSGNLQGISYSSIRAGLLEFRRKCEQFQHAVFVHQFCRPIFLRWMKEAQAALVFGIKGLNDYNKDPDPWESVQWVTPGWPWVDPEKEVKAFQMATRAGYNSRSAVCGQQGESSATIDAQQKNDNDRADGLGLSYDSDGRKVLNGKNAGQTEEEIAEQDEKGPVQP